jgi:hypothetical protein
LFSFSFFGAADTARVPQGVPKLRQYLLSVEGYQEAALDHLAEKLIAR